MIHFLSRLPRWLIYTVRFFLYYVALLVIFGIVSGLTNMTIESDIIFELFASFALIAAFILCDLKNPNSTPPRSRKSMWGAIFILSVTISIVAILILGSNLPFLLLFPPAWIVALMLIISPLYYVDAIGLEKGKNWSGVILISGSIFVAMAARALVNDISFGSIVPFLFIIYVDAPLLVSYLIVRNIAHQKRLSWKIILLVYTVVFTLSFISSWNSEHNRIFRLSDDRTSGVIDRLIGSQSLHTDDVVGFYFNHPSSWIRVNNIDNPLSFRTEKNESIVVSSFAVEPHLDVQQWFESAFPSDEGFEYVESNGMLGLVNPHRGVAHFRLKKPIILTVTCQNYSGPSSTKCDDSHVDFMVLLSTLQEK
jgi:hypothetical protein